MKYPKLKAAVKRKWLRDLRSGKFKQGTGQLKRPKGSVNYDGPTGKDGKLQVHTCDLHCCLGVLHEGQRGKLSHSECQKGSIRDDIFQRFFRDRTVIEAETDLSEIQSILADYNDSPVGFGHKTFRGIATWIEKNL